MTGEDLVLRWGIAACGKISHDFCTALKSIKTGKHVLQAVGARHLDDAQKFAQSFGIPTWYGSYDELFADRNVNVVYIGSINTTHKDICLKAINAGKHVLCEKPLTLNVKDFDEVVSAAQKKKVFFMQGLWTRFFPVTKKVEEEVKSGAIGELKFFNGSFLLPDKGVERVTRKDLGGGALFDLGIYPIQWACMLFDHEKPLKVTATGHLNENGVDECSTIVLLYSNNRIATINSAINCMDFHTTFIIGDKGYIEIPDHSWCPTKCYVNGEEFSQKLPECGPTIYDNSAGFVYEAEEVRQAIAKGLLEHPRATNDMSRLVMSIVEEASVQLGNAYQ